MSVYKCELDSDLIGLFVGGAGSHTAEPQHASRTAAGSQQLSYDWPIFLFEGKHAAK